MSRSPSESDSRRERRGTKARDDMSDDDDRKAKKSSARSDDDDDDRGKSRERPRESDRNEKVTKVLPIDKDDAAFVLGRGGATKRKIARVSGSEIDLDEHSLKITLSGTAKQTEAASDYIDYVSQQRVGPVNIKPDRSRNDFSAVKVPAECIGFVMGRNGQTLRSMEEEWGVLMFFAKIGGGREAERESLCIFGSLPSRRGAEVKVMSAIEHKNPGSCVSSKGELRDVERVEGDADVDGWSTDTVLLGEDNYSYALGARGSTRRKLAAASGCIIEYVGHLACFCGYKKDRRRGKDYLRWLIEQRTGNSVVEKPHDRDDCLVFKIPTSSIAFITGHRGETLRGIERESSTFCFTDGDRNTRSKEFEDLLIFSFSRSAREHACEIVEERLSQHKRMGGPSPADGGARAPGARAPPAAAAATRLRLGRDRGDGGGARGGGSDRRDDRGGGDRRDDRRDDRDKPRRRDDSEDSRDRNRRDRSREKDRRGGDRDRRERSRSRDRSRRH